MATTYYKSRHTTKGKTTLQTMKDCFNYCQNPLKTRNGELIKSYMCDHETAYAEFELSKAKYKAITGREQKKDKDVFYYHKRQAFYPTKLTMPIRMKSAMKQLCAEQKANMPFSWYRMLTGPTRICISITTQPRWIVLTSLGIFLVRGGCSDDYLTAYVLSIACQLSKIPQLHSKGRFKHYGAWLGDKPPNFQARLKAQIDMCLAEKPPSMEVFLLAMAAAGYGAKNERGSTLSFHAPGQERFTCLRLATLGAGYGLEDIIAIIQGQAESPPPLPHKNHKRRQLLNRLCAA